MRWTGKRYEFPGEGPGPIVRLIHALEDWWRSLDGIDKSLWGLLGLAIALWIVILWAAR
jgi:hypothetical protein